MYGRAAALAAMEEDAAIAARFLLPVSGIDIELCYPTGIDDVLIDEADVDDPALGLTISASPRTGSTRHRLGRAHPGGSRRADPEIAPGAIRQPHRR